MSVSEKSITSKEAKREAQRKAMLRKCHCLARAYVDGDIADNPHDALKAYAKAAINYKGSLSDISHTNLRRLCASLDRKVNGKKYKDPREQFFKKYQPEAEAAGKAGRKGSNIDGIATAADLLLIQKYADALGWNKKRLDGWIRKRTGKALTLQEIKYVSQVNIILWPMKRMLNAGEEQDRNVIK